MTVMTTPAAAAATSKRRPKRSRLPPSPNSILDRKALVAALEAAGLYGRAIQPVHLTCFYHALHRQHYPETLQAFVETYYENEQARKSNNNNNNSRSNNNNETDDRPLKNSVTVKKNRNKMQLPKALLEFLTNTDQFVVLTSTVAQKQTSADGSTTKLAIQLHDGQLVESVLMRYYTQGASGGSTTSSRASLCVSSQCGCAMGCTFCATGTMGLSGNLTTGEILEQVVHADRILADEWQAWKENHPYNPPKLDLVRNIVFMGMGEPLDNYRNVIEACRALIDNKRWNLAHKCVTVSTVGIVDKMRKLTQELPEVNLALSLHAPNQAMRSAIVPTAKYFPIEQLIDALDGHMMAYLEKRKKKRDEKNKRNGETINDSKREYTVEERIHESTRRRAMIEYVMLEGETSTIEAAHQLGKLCEGRQLVVNLIPYNQTDVKDKLRCPSDSHMNEFRNIVASYGTFCTIRRTMGADIDSACGQLITLQKKNDASPNNGGSSGVGDIEDVASNGNETNCKSVSKARKSSNLLAKCTMAEESKSIVSTSEAECGIDLERWIRPLAIATSVAASCFVVSTALFLKQKRR